MRDPPGQLSTQQRQPADHFAAKHVEASQPAPMETQRIRVDRPQVRRVRHRERGLAASQQTVPAQK